MPKTSRDLKEFDALFNRKTQIRKRLQNALAELRKSGREEWRTERELIDSARVGTKDIGEFREEFRAHIVIVPGANRGRTKSIWFADPKVAAKVRQ